MDVLSAITYRDFELNNVSTNVDSGISGCEVDSLDVSDIDVVQYTEKRSLEDGMDAGDVYLGARRVRMAGTLYATSRPLLFDALQNLRSALSPTLAFRELPGDKGYRPLLFSVPTARTATNEYPAGLIPLQIRVMPRAFQSVIQRDMTGGVAGDPLAITWQATMVARDPRITAQDRTEVAFTPTVNKTGNLLNRGDYHSSLNFQFTVTAAAGVITVTAGGSNFTLTIPASTGNRVIQVKGEDKAVYVEEEGLSSLRMDIITFQNSTTWPLVNSGTTPYTVTFSGGIVLADTTSVMWFYESYA